MDSNDLNQFIKSHLGTPMYPWQKELLARAQGEIEFHKKWEWDQWNEWAKRQIQISDAIEEGEKTGAY